LFGVAIASATLPASSRSAAAGRMDEFRDTLSRSLGLVFLLTGPAAVGLIVLREPIVGLIYERGQFTAYDTQQTASALAYYCVGLAAYAAVKVLTPAYYAGGAHPHVGGGLLIALNYGLTTLIHVLGWDTRIWRYRHRSLQPSISSCSLVHAPKRTGFEAADWPITGAHRGATAGMGLVCWAVSQARTPWERAFGRDWPPLPLGHGRRGRALRAVHRAPSAGVEAAARGALPSHSYRRLSSAC
jgi:hypothetical protein